MLFFVGALNYCDRAAIVSVLPLIRTDLQMSDLDLAATGTFFLWSYAIASPLAGWLADRTSRGLVVLISLVAASVLTIATGLVTTTGQLWVVRGLLGVVEAAYLPAAMALIAEYHGNESRATAIGIHAAGLGVGSMMGAAGTAYLSVHFGWHAGFIIIGVVGLAAAIPTGLIVRDLAPAHASAPLARHTSSLAVSLLALSRFPVYLIVLAAGMAVAVENHTFANWFPLYFSEVYHLGLAQAGLAGTAAIQIATILAVLLGSLYSDRISRGHPRRRTLIPFVASLTAAPFLLVFLASPGLLLLNVCVFAFTFIHVFGDCNMSPIVAEVLPPRLWSTAFGTINAGNCLVGGLGVLFAGLLKSRYGLGSVFCGISGITLLAGILFLVAHQVYRRQLSMPAELKPEAL